MNNGLFRRSGSERSGGLLAVSPLYCIILLAIFGAVVVFELMRTAWIGDDAAITLRTVLNFTHGFGPVFNIGERVQAYTHPLWFLLISGFTVIHGNVFYSALALSFICALATLALLVLRVGIYWRGTALALSVLVLSKAYVDYSTSGLENPLSHLLLILSFITATASFNSKTGPNQEAISHTAAIGFFILCGLMYLNRPDLLILLFPMSVWLAIRLRQQPALLIRSAMAGAIPVLVWTAFSLFYYGFPFPNTAYAKLGAGIEISERIQQGLEYLDFSLLRDKITLLAVGAALVASLWLSALYRALALGILLYLGYVVYIGGDFMEGRFLTTPLVGAAIILSALPLRGKALVTASSLLVIIGLLNSFYTLLSNADYKDSVIRANGIADERGYYFNFSGLSNMRHPIFHDLDWTLSERTVAVICGGLGFQGILRGPSTHMIDTCGLADPLLARLPARFDPNWRIGHYIRQLPTNYKQTVEDQMNRLADASTREFYEEIQRITQGPLLSWDRFKSIIAMNMGTTAVLPDWDYYRHEYVAPSSGAVTLRYHDVQRLVANGTPWDDSANRTFTGTVIIKLEKPKSIAGLDVSVDNNDQHVIEAWINDQWQFIAAVEGVPGPGMQRRRIWLETPSAATRKVRLRVIDGDGKYALGHLVLFKPNVYKRNQG